MTSWFQVRRYRLALGAFVALGLALGGPAAAQQTGGTLTGIVTSEDGGQPLGSVQVQLEGTSFSSITDQNGRYLIPNVPAGTYTVVAQVIGYATGRVENVRVTAGATVANNIRLRIQALAIQEIIVTGVTDPVSGVKAPFTVGRVSMEQMPNPPAASPLSALAGRVSGVHVVTGSGQPGSTTSIQLRTPTSIQRSSAPLIVVDGVILGANAVDIETLDLESIEVLKGAAAASLYGSRAAGGVIQIRTQRGANQALDRTRITARSEIGTSSLARKMDMAQHHFWEVDANGQFVLAPDPTGRLSDRERRVQRAVPFMDQPWGVQTYNQLEQFYTPGNFQTHSFTVSQNTASTNWLATIGHRQEAGVIRTNDGLEQNSFRLNLDHRLRDNFTLGFSGYHMRNHRDDLSGTPFFDLLLLPPDVNLLARDSLGNLMMQPDPTLTSENPIWRQTSRDNNRQRFRTLASVNTRFQPLHGLSFEGNFSYDRSDRQFQQYVPKGTPSIGNLQGLDGSLRYDEQRTDHVNGAIGANYMHTFGGLTTRTSLRGVIEREKAETMWILGERFRFDNVPSIGATIDRSGNSSQEEIRSNGYFWMTGLDYLGKYVGDVLIRRDGSSLFGDLDRWNTYYRASGAYRMAEEPWWPVAPLTEFKLSYSIGTAGGRPNFGDRFETVSVSGTTGAISRSNLGNRYLRPEHTTEQELGLLTILNNRYSLQLAYATSVTRDQLVQMPQPAVTGFFAQWQNSGTIEGHTYEATLEAQLVQTPNLSWSANLVADRSRHKITEWNRPCFQSGVTYRCGGETLGMYYGHRFATSPDDLPARFADFAGQFQVNDEGYLVWVGTGGAWSDAKWGTQQTLGGATVRWGHPIRVEENGQVANVRIGDANPSFKMGLGNNLRWRGLSLYALLDATVGNQIYNSTKQRMYQHSRSADLDQFGRAPEAKKPVQYYQTLYNANNVNSHFVESGSFAKLREVSVRYALDQGRLERFGLGRVGMDRVSLGLIGRNLFTFSNYSGFDPEVGNTTLMQDDFGYPNFRTITGMVEIQF
jgi:TonB-linked SusC/RagA family outer membrane protein